MSDRNIIIVLLVVQLALCLPVITLFPISLDEPFSIYHSQFPLSDMLEEVQKGNNSPLHFILLHYWIKVFGVGAFGVRLLSVVFSLVSVVFLYKLARKFWEPIFAVLPVSLFILSRLDHYVAMEARMYGLFTLFVILIIYDFYRLVFEKKKVYIQLGVWNALLLYTHYIGGTVVLLECLVFLAFYKEWDKGVLLQLGLVVGVGGLLFFPGLTVFLERAGEFTAQGSWVPETKVLDLWTNLVKLFNNQFALFVTLAILFGFAMVLKVNWKENSRSLLFFSVWFIGGFLLLFLLSVLVQPVFFIKYLQFLTIPLFFLLTAFMASIKFQNKAYLSLVLLFPFVLSFKPIPDINRNTDELVSFIKEHKSTATKIYYCPPHYSLTLAYHYDQEVFKDFTKTDSLLKSDNIFPVYGPDAIGTDASHLIYVDFDSRLLYPDNGILKFLDENYAFENSKAFKGDFSVYIYSNN